MKHDFLQNCVSLTPIDSGQLAIIDPYIHIARLPSSPSTRNCLALIDRQVLRKFFTENRGHSATLELVKLTLNTYAWQILTGVTTVEVKE